MDVAILPPGIRALLSLRLDGLGEEGIGAAMSVPSVSSEPACKQCVGEFRVVPHAIRPLADDLDDPTCPLWLEAGTPPKSAPSIHDSDALGGIRAI